ncbi:hypothetical protein [Yoonia sp.]|uniref:hypothetical protein n=1 Tax=Yoonia sp. TaxID=2212373 RepID=UPI003A4DDF0D
MRVIVTLSEVIFTLIETRTFSNIWYWMAVGVTWATVSHWIIGVPFDMIFSARKHGGQAMLDLDRITDINVRRLMQVAGTPGLVVIAMGAFFITSAAMLGFGYGLELAQGLFCLAFPLVIVGALTWRTTQRLAIHPVEGEALVKALLRLRFWIQVVAMTAIFFTAIYGMYTNLSRMSLF